MGVNTSKYDYSKILFSLILRRKLLCKLANTNGEFNFLKH